MELIIGGAAQGKLQYALQYSNVNSSDVFCTLHNRAKIVNNLHLIILDLLKQNLNPTPVVLEFADLHPNVIFICNEVGAGLVPIDPFEREYREAVGRICCALAARATKVHRIFCGIGIIIKDV